MAASERRLLLRRFLALSVGQWAPALRASWAAVCMCDLLVAAFGVLVQYAEGTPLRETHWHGASAAALYACSTLYDLVFLGLFRSLIFLVVGSFIGRPLPASTLAAAAVAAVVTCAKAACWLLLLLPRGHKEAPAKWLFLGLFLAVTAAQAALATWHAGRSAWRAATGVEEPAIHWRSLADADSLLETGSAMDVTGLLSHTSASSVTQSHRYGAVVLGSELHAVETAAYSIQDVTRRPPPPQQHHQRRAFGHGHGRAAAAARPLPPGSSPVLTASASSSSSVTSSIIPAATLPRFLNSSASASSVSDFGDDEQPEEQASPAAGGSRGTAAAVAAAPAAAGGGGGSSVPSTQQGLSVRSAASAAFTGASSSFVDFTGSATGTGTSDDSAGTGTAAGAAAAETAAAAAAAAAEAGGSFSSGGGADGSDNDGGGGDSSRGGVRLRQLQGLRRSLLQPQGVLLPAFLLAYSGTDGTAAGAAVGAAAAGAGVGGAAEALCSFYARAGGPAARGLRLLFRAACQCELQQQQGQLWTAARGTSPTLFRGNALYTRCAVLCCGRLLQPVLSRVWKARLPERHMHVSS